MATPRRLQVTPPTPADCRCTAAAAAGPATTCSPAPASADAATATATTAANTLRRAERFGVESLRQAQADVIADHLWLARAIAHRYRRPDQDVDDLFQVACVGLVEAVHRFDPDRGDFLAYASATMTGLVKHHFRDHTWHVRPTRGRQELLTAMRRIWPGLTQELGHEPSHEQLAQRLGVSADEVALAHHCANGYRATSLDLLADMHHRLGQSDRPHTDRIEARLMIDRALAELDEDDRQLIRLRFYEERSQAQIAVILGTNQMQVSRRLARLIRRLHRIVGAPG
ncbi:MAG: sigma-70 family RNA polymerase sigma factor [Propionibacteriaceae bacterium]|nr:sigma-70 family RNA polymerase sigma factor [Propionibacteriaceae bacterium]